MADESDDLTDEQKEAFRGRSAQTGLGSDALSHPDTPVTGGRPGPTILPGNPHESHVPPTPMTVNPIEELEALRGVPDGRSTVRGGTDASIDYPQELPQGRNRGGSKS